MITSKFILSTLSIFFLYLILASYLTNYSLVLNTLVENYSLDYKLSLLSALFLGFWLSVPKIEVFLTMLIALLTGINLSILIVKANLLRKSKRIKLVVGGSSLLGIVGSGCGLCGLSILNILGFSGFLTYLPFKGTEFTMVSVVLLSISLYFLRKNYQETKACLIK